MKLQSAIVLGRAGMVELKGRLAEEATLIPRQQVVEAVGERLTRVLAR